jgi:hypothetical protein
MGNAKRDNNSVTVEMGVSNADGVTLLSIQANPTTHVLQTLDGVTGSDMGTPNAKRDGNSVTAMMAVSSADGKTPVALYIDAATNKLLVLGAT